MSQTLVAPSPVAVPFARQQAATPGGWVAGLVFGLVCLGAGVVLVVACLLAAVALTLVALVRHGGRPRGRLRA